MSSRLLPLAVAVLTAACVPGADSQAYARQELGLEKVYGDFREMVADPEVDAVAIVSPSGEHCWQIEAALDRLNDEDVLDVECSRSGNVLEIEFIDNGTKIIVNSAWVKEHCLFKDAS